MDDLLVEARYALGNLKNLPQSTVETLKNAGQNIQPGVTNTQGPNPQNQAGQQGNNAQAQVGQPGQGGNHPPPGNAFGLHKPGRQQLEVQNQGQQFQFRLNPRANGNSPFADAGPRGHHYGHWNNHGHSESHGSHGTYGLNSAIYNYLRGDSDGSGLRPQVRYALDAVSDALGSEWANNLNSKNGERVVRLFEHAIEHASHTFEHALNQANRAHGNGQHEGFSIEPEVHRMVENLLSAAQLGKHFDKLDKAGSNFARQAEAAVAQYLFGDKSAVGERVHLSAAELLRDLRSGAFRPPGELFNPFPLTGRARVASEMMELMRTLDAIERVVRQLEGRHNTGQQGGLDGALKGRLTGGALAAFEELASMFPGLPGRAGRNEIPKLIGSLGGMLTDASGRPLVAADGTALKLDQLLWLSTAGGLLKGSFNGEMFPVRLSPLLMYGFDAVYSVIGFDGRTLNPPHFAAVQAQINGSELDWVFGQAPLTEGWMRALIERLKDSVLADHNILGEMLEEALAAGRFHAALVSGSVEEGEAVAGSFKVTRLLPSATGEPAFNYA